MVIFDSTRREVKSSRVPNRFGVGVLPSRPAHRADFLFSDAQWWAAERAVAEDRHYDRLADEATAQARLDAGLCL